MYDCIIIGAGPAGISAGIYAARASMKTIIIEKGTPGGLIAKTDEIANYPGVEDVPTGSELIERMIKQAKSFGAEFITDTVVNVDLSGTTKVVYGENDTYEGKSVIITTGSNPRLLNVPGEKEFTGKGIAYCATCDGAFTKGRTVSLVGKGDELIEESLFLTRYAKEVNVFLTSDDLDCSEELKEAILSKENVKIVKKVKLLEIKGEEFVTELDLEIEGNKETTSTDFVFLYLGTKNNLELYGEFVSLSDAGYIVTDETMKTRTDKMYAIGDIREKDIRQIATATNDGVIAASFIMKEILKAKKK